MVYRGSQVGPMFGLRREIDRLFEDTFGRDSARGGGWVPPVDVREDAKEIVLEIELPGIRPDDVEVTAENGVLSVRGEKQSRSTEDTQGRYHVVERTYGSFSRSFQLPNGVDERQIEAEFVDGLLQVRVPKAALAQPRRIEIRNSGSQPAIQGGTTGAASMHARKAREDDATESNDTSTDSAARARATSGGGSTGGSGSRSK
jgi:HSP20 family protein